MLDRIKTLFKNKLFKQILRLVLSAAAIYIITQKVDLPKAWSYITQAKIFYLVLAFLSFFVSRWFAAFRVNVLYRTQGLNIPEKTNLKLYFLGMFYNLFIPLVGGEGYKAIWIKNRYDFKYKPLVGAAFLDRLSGLALLASLSVIYLILSSLDLGFNKWLCLAAIPFILVGHYLFMKFFFKSFLSSWKAISIYSLIIQALQVVTTYFILVALGTTDLINDYLFIFLLSSFAFVLPMLGAREMAFIFGARELGLDMELSLAVSLLFYLSTALNSFAGGFFILFPSMVEKNESSQAKSDVASSDHQ